MRERWGEERERERERLDGEEREGLDVGERERERAEKGRCLAVCFECGEGVMAKGERGFHNGRI